MDNYPLWPCIVCDEYIPGEGYAKGVSALEAKACQCSDSKG